MVKETVGIVSPQVAGKICASSYVQKKLMKSLEEIHLARGNLSGLILSLFGYRYRSVSLSGNCLTFLAKTPRKIFLSDIAGPAHVTSIFGLPTFALPINGNEELRVAGIKPVDAAKMVSKVNSVWKQNFAEKVDAIEDELQVLSNAVKRLEQPRRFPSACLLEPFWERSNGVLKRLPTEMPEGVLPADRRELLDTVLSFQETPEHKRENAIKAFIATELHDLEEFFDTIESNPLTPEQRLAVITDEDATLVLAGAGSGKTSVIVAKAAYLLQRRIRRPQEVLLMAFGKDAAAEMESRIEARTGEKVDARTFHALGYEIIRDVENGAPALAPHASDEAQFRTLLRDILINDVATRPVLALLLLKWFSEFETPYKSEWDFKTKHEYYRHVESRELRTLQGEVVKSFEELEIANWLYVNGIAYEYEPDYEYDLPENNRKAYQPDFHLKDSGIYIEHFGVRKSLGHENEVVLTTAPYVDRKTYLEGMEWKRNVHRDHGTTLIETYSYERVEGRLTDALKTKLEPYVTFDPISPEHVLEQLSGMGQIDAFTQTLGTFLRHFKSSASTIEQCRRRARKVKDKARSLAFLEIFEPLYINYQERLGTRIDFEDMIVRATEHVRSGRYRSPYRHLLVDEFQDISEDRAQLLKALKQQHSDARIFAVGDDWQSIYRFTGSDIHLMRNFGAEFGGKFASDNSVHSIVDLGRTFRSIDRIALPARTFVLKNPTQITKQVAPAGKGSDPAISVAYYSRNDESAALRIVLDTIQASSNEAKTSVLMLGRYNFVRPKNFAQLVRNYPNLSIRFMTVHSSKGLEADHVVVLRTGSGRMGFPSEVVDDPILDLVLPEPELFEHAEERRLFYVALTRARKTVTILTDRESPSVFASELIEDPAYGATELDQSSIAKRRCGNCGGRMLAKKARNGQTYFACEHQRLCGEKTSPCSACGTDLPVLANKDTNLFVCSCGAEYPACPECVDGWLVERKGRHGKFLGCVNFPKCEGKKSLTKQRQT